MGDAPMVNPRGVRDLRRRGGFTLVEMLVVVAIIGILASMMLGALASARSFAMESRTRALIAKLDTVVMAQYASYRTRRVPIDTGGMRPDVAADLRLRALRELMRMEMPERDTDIFFPKRNPDPKVPPVWDDEERTQLVTGRSRDGTIVERRRLGRPALARAYFRRYLDSRPTSDYFSAECLYLMVTLTNPDARERFVASEIGDVDDDGWPEFIDGWGNPVAFLRWAPAFNDSDLQPNIIPAHRLEDGTDWEDPPSWQDPEIKQRLQDAAKSAHDPFDAANAHRAAWRLLPLIYSAGPDGIYDIGRDRKFVFRGDPYWIPGSKPPEPNGSGLPLDSANTSYTATEGANGSLDHYDNIHNHRTEVR